MTLVHPARRIGGTVLAAWLALAASAGPVRAEPAPVDTAEVEAVGRALGFVESLPHGLVRLGVVHAPGDVERARWAAAALDGITGQGMPTLQARAVAANRLAGIDDIDVLFVLPGVSEDYGEAIAAAVRQQHLFSVSTDPACLQANCCVLMVQARPRVEIVIDTSMARAAGARFSLIFAAMVRRK